MKNESKYQKILENSQNIQKMDIYIQIFIHIPKLKFWSVTTDKQMQHLQGIHTYGKKHRTPDY